VNTTGADASGNGTGAAGHTVAVVGGGIAGLSAAWAITSAAPGTNVVVLESDRRLGGKVQTGMIGGRAVELGPDAFLARRPEAVALCRELGLGDDLVSPGSRTAYVWARGTLRRRFRSAGFRIFPPLLAGTRRFPRNIASSAGSH